MDFHQAPFIAIWETTQACDLACVHCRARAQPFPLPEELSPEEGLALIDEVTELGAQVMVLSGGDPLKRADLIALIRHGKEKGLRMATIPAATPLLTPEKVRELKEAGLDQMALSLDASTAQAHDRFRGVEGTFEKTLQAVQWAHEVELPVQINTVMSRHNFEDVEGLINLVRQLGIVFWEVFFLVPVGRGAQIPGLSAREYEAVFSKLYEVALKAPFVLKVTEAPHFRRYFFERWGREEGIDPRQILSGALPPFPELRRIMGPPGRTTNGLQAINSGKGFVFISCQGEVYPSGFLPLSAGNVRGKGLKSIYRDAELFKALRNPDQLQGRCGVCEYRFICGGSRSRAYALTGDPAAEEPCCAYVPRP